MYNALAIEDLGKPVVSLVHPGFLPDARSAASSRGMPGARIIPLNVPNEGRIASEFEAGAIKAMPDIIDGLTKPLTAEEKSPTPRDATTPRIAFRGNYEAVNRFYYRNGWTDGLPIVPPTDAAVKEMLTGTDLPADHIVAKVIPRLGKATVEKIAINAVMAGALPTHMPVLIAAVQALEDQRTRFDTFEVSTGSWAPFFIINGPIRNDIHVNFGSGALSPGNIANSAIGRAVGLIVKNIGGARKGIEDMGVIGNPSKYSLVIGENEEETPWDPLHVERGFKKEDNVITVFFPNNFLQNVPGGGDAQGIAQSLASLQPISMSAVIVIPQLAKTLADGGFTKERLKQFILENGAPARKTQTADASTVLATPPRAFNTEELMILVAGGPGAWAATLRSVGGISNSFVSKKVELPRNWDELVKKYRNIVPVYVEY
jgi:hypothetical protein